jgi:hypothetical protein
VGVAVAIACATGVGVTTAIVGVASTFFAPAFAVSFVLVCSSENGCGRYDEPSTKTSKSTATATKVQPIVYFNAVPIE